MQVEKWGRSLNDLIAESKVIKAELAEAWARVYNASWFNRETRLDELGVVQARWHAFTARLTFEQSDRILNYDN